MSKLPQDYPLTLNAKDVSEIMRVGLSKAYSLIKRSDFPAIVDGNRYIIPRDTFFRWLDQTASVKFEKHSS